MKWSTVQVLGILALIFVAVKADSDLDDLPELPEGFDLEDLEDLDLDDNDLEEDDEILRDLEEKHLASDLARENELASQIATDVAAEFNKINSPKVEVDPCSKIHCGAGRICHASGEKASCICIPECPYEPDERRRVCTNKNETWSSDCDVYRQRCLCDTNNTQCKGPGYKHFHIDYYGPCKVLAECKDGEMEDFPRRMRDWLFNVMRDLAERSELNEHYMQMELEAETNLTRRWSNAAVWKWCDLDGDIDRSVSRHELFPIRAPLIALEHCIAPFLESCDQDKDHRITLKEWGNCLQIDEEEMLERCDDIRKPVNMQQYG